jgi:hypothetical protein
MREKNSRHEKKVLFVCKKRNKFYGPSFGLINSCKFIVNTLRENKIDSKIVVVNDNNDIDREVHQYKPTHVFIEALWVVPEKFKELLKLYPKVQWYVRIHSKIPFLANEGIAMHWMREYDLISKVFPNFHLSANSKEVCNSFFRAYEIPVFYFPNIYNPDKYEDGDEDYNDGRHWYNHNKDNKKKIFPESPINIGCFGAIRPFKNQLNQVFAAISFGNLKGRKINFHINFDRCETNGESVLKNLDYAFKNTPHALIYHSWLPHDVFIKLVKKMDVGLQVSFSETFDIVAADFAWNNIPIVGSPEIFWLDKKYAADPNNIEDMIDKLYFAYDGIKNNKQKINRKKLESYNEDVTEVWLESL